MTTLREAAQQALDYMNSVGQMDMCPEEWAIVGRLEAALAEPQSTHSAACYQWHHKCAIAEVERLREENRLWHSRAVALFWKCDTDNITIARLQSAAKEIDAALRQEQPQ